jgi:hypothetical protein
MNSGAVLTVGVDFGPRMPIAVMEWAEMNKFDGVDEDE